MRNDLLKNGSMLLTIMAFLAMTHSMNAQYCEATSTSVEPITRVLFAAIDNASSPDTGSEGYEDFTAIVAEVEEGETYNFTAEGNTNGPYESYFTVWIDWNKNDEFEEDEKYEIGSIEDSDGTDGQQVTNDIVVPSDAVSGETRMRVRKKWNAFPDDPCDTSIFGQTEDYTVNVSAGGGECAFDITSIVEPISRLIMSNVDNSSPAVSTVALDDFTDTVITAIAGGSYDIALEGNTRGSWTNYFTVFINTNPDNDWSTYETFEIGSISGSTGTDGQQAIKTITIPADLAEGEYLLRVVKSFGSSPMDPCSTYSFGQGEDYTLLVEDLNNCTGTPDAGVASVNPEEGNANSGYTVSASAYDIANGLTYQWQSNTDGAGWINEAEAGDNYAAFAATAPSENGVVVEWRLKIICSFSGEIAYSDIAIFTTSGVYCTPMLDCMVFGDMITNVTFQEIDNTTDCSTEGYGDYTSMTANVESGNTYPISVSVGDGWIYESVSVWIDFDESGTFDEDEFFYIGTGSDETLTADILIPVGQADGDYRMRVRVVSEDVDAATWDMACDEDQGFGETEDYTVSVSGGTAGVDCGQGDDSNAFEDGFNIKAGGNFRNADDFIVSSDNTLNIRSIELNLISDEPITSLDFNFYNDDNGAPGTTVVESLSDVVPYAQVMIGAAFGYNVYAVFVEVDLDFEGGASGTTYWMQPSAQVGAQTVAFWEVSSVGTLGEPIHTSEGGGAWTPDENESQAVFKLHCDVATPPDTVCLFDIIFEVEPITRMVMANVDNSSPVDSTEALEDFTSEMIMAEAGGSYDVALEGYTGGTWTNYFTIFINTGGEDEWSSYETFEIGSITGSTGTDGRQATRTITLPANLEGGEYLLRVVKSFDSSPLDPCSIYDFGQGEDYTLIIGELIDCSGTPDGGVASVNPEEGNVNTNYNVYATGYTVGNGLTYQWQSNTDQAGWEDEGDLEDHYSSFAATAPSENGIEVEWRLEVTCTFSQETSYSETAFFTTAVVYCIPILDCEDDNVITNVTFQEIDNTTACSPDGYGDYTSMAATVQSGGTYPISVSVGDGWDYESISVWIDFDDNGVFDQDEFFYIGSESGQTSTEDISIPADLPDGDYRMRVRVAAVGEELATWDLSCDEEQLFGETEDYTVTVDGVAGMDDNAISNFTYYPNPVNDVLNITANKDIVSVSAYNVLGQEVINNKNFADGKVDVSSLSTGTFIFRVTFENGNIEDFKVMKK